MAVHVVYRFYAELEGYKPRIWRRFEVNGSQTMAELGYILMTMFEMQASHLFCFTHDYAAEEGARLRQQYDELDIRRIIGGTALADWMRVWRFALPLEDDEEIYEGMKLCDARSWRLKDLPGFQRLTFQYDFGDNWLVNLRMESCEKVEIHASRLPRVLEGAGFGIIEDCGGVGGLKELAKAFGKKKGRDYDEYRAWLGVEELDLNTFDIDDMNFRLKKIPRIYKECYEFGYEPTQRSVDLIERKYRK